MTGSWDQQALTAVVYEGDKKPEGVLFRTFQGQKQHGCQVVHALTVTDLQMYARLCAHLKSSSKQHAGQGKQQNWCITCGW